MTETLEGRAREKAESLSYLTGLQKAGAQTRTPVQRRKTDLDENRVLLIQTSLGAGNTSSLHSLNICSKPSCGNWIREILD